MGFLGARNLTFSSHFLCLQKMSPIPKLQHIQPPIFASPAPDLPSKLQTHIFRYLLVNSTHKSYTISNRKCPEKDSVSSLLLLPTQLPSLLPVSVKRHHLSAQLLMIRNWKPSATSLSPSLPPSLQSPGLVNSLI